MRAEQAGVILQGSEKPLVGGPNLREKPPDAAPAPYPASRPQLALPCLPPAPSFRFIPISSQHAPAFHLLPSQPNFNLPFTSSQPPSHLVSSSTITTFPQSLPFHPLPSSSYLHLPSPPHPTLILPSLRLSHLHSQSTPHISIAIFSGSASFLRGNPPPLPRLLLAAAACSGTRLLTGGARPLLIRGG